jgi:putative transcriptional regulator
MIKTMNKKTINKTAKKSTKVRAQNKQSMSGITESVYATAKDLLAAGSIDQATMREFDALCLPKVPSYTARQIKALRTRCNCSQPVFAAYLNVTPSSLKQWESGVKKPAAAACKLLNLVERKGLEALA